MARGSPGGNTRGLHRNQAHAQQSGKRFSGLHDFHSLFDLREIYIEIDAVVANTFIGGIPNLTRIAHHVINLPPTAGDLLEYQIRVTVKAALDGEDFARAAAIP